MTEVAFHFNAPDKLSYACRLLRKACSTSAQVVVMGTDELIAALDAALWTFSPTAFVPHCLASADPQTLRQTPVVLGQGADVPSGLPHHQVLLNLGSELLSGFETFEKVIEVVTQDEQDRAMARLRWKHYADRGYALVRHDLRLKT
jgi:DNA polymerase-3 subunit chi